MEEGLRSSHLLDAVADGDEFVGSPDEAVLLDGLGAFKHLKKDTDNLILKFTESYLRNTYIKALRIMSLDNSNQFSSSREPELQSTR